jgi:hypothetical protein
MNPVVALERTGRSLTVTTPVYRLEIRETEPVCTPYAVLSDPAGQEWTQFSLLSSVATVEAPDEVFSFGDISARRAGDDIEITAVLSSTAWTSHETRALCTIGFAGVLVPAPTEPIQLVRPARSAAVLGVVGDADPGRLNAIFSSPPLALGLSRLAAGTPTHVPNGDWLGLWLRAPIDELGFPALRYDPVDSGFLLRLDLEGHTFVDGSWTSPVFVLRPAATGWSVLDEYRNDLVAKGAASNSGPAVLAWWREPIFCGWGAQCVRSAHRLLRGTSDPAIDVPPETDSEEALVSRGAAGYARADVYDEFLDRLAAHDLIPGTVVIDDRWQGDYGTGTVDETSWPDLAGWIAARHAAGQRVLLWWKAWDPQGIPVEECIRDAGGRADGFKVDSTQRVPSGRTLTAHGDEWGITA